jgi:hypothetical protein
MTCATVLREERKYKRRNWGKWRRKTVKKRVVGGEGGGENYI